MSDTYRLQLRHVAETNIFGTRDEVIEYINGQLTYGGVSILPHEFVLFYYGEEDAKNAIIMVGLPEGDTNDGASYFLIDTADLAGKITAREEADTVLQNAIDAEATAREEADTALQGNIDAEATAREEADTTLQGNIDTEATAREETDTALRNAIDAEATAREEADAALQGDIDATSDDLSSVIEACGLVYNEKLSSDKVSYEPDSHDEIIRDAESLSDAIDKISKFVAEVSESLTISVDDTETVDLTLDENEDGGKTITADVRIAGTNGLSKSISDNNIIGTTSEGIYASATLEQSPDNVNVLVFKTSGYVDGEFKVDAYETEVSLTPYSGDSGKSTGIAVSVDDEKNVISAQLNLSTEETNILELVDGEYSVDGRAKNIRYKNTTVAAALASQGDRLDEIEGAISGLKAIEVNGSESDTVTVTSTKSSKDDYTIAANVKLSTDNSIVVSNGGLSANVSASYNTGTSTLTLNVGSKAYTVDLAGLAVSVLKSATYDSTNEQIILTFEVGDTTKTLTIPVGTLIHDTEVDDTETVDLTLTSVSGGPNRISAKVIIDTSSSDNILTSNSNGLYVSNANITNAIDSATTAAKEREAQVLSDAKAYTDTATSTLAKDVEANATAIATETTRATEEEADLLEKIDANAAAISAEATTAREAESANATAISAEATTARAAESANAKAIETETTRATAAENANATAIATETTRAMEKEADLLAKIDANTAAISAEATTARAAESANATAISAEAATAREAESANAKAIETETTRATAAENANATAIATETTRATEKEADLLAKIEANATAISAEATTAREAESANATAISAEATTARAAESANAKAIETETTRATAAESANATAIATETTRATEKEADLLAKIEANAAAISANALDISTNGKDISTNASDIATLKSSVTSQSLSADETNSVKIALDKQDTGTTISADVKLDSTTEGNILKISGNGVYATVTLSYNSATNTLTFANGSSTTEIQLSDHTLITAGYYDSSTEAIILQYTVDGEAKSISIPAKDLVHTLSVDNSDANPVKLKLTQDSNGVDTLSASVDISTAGSNLIISDNGTLYASKSASDHTVTYGTEETTVQLAINALKEEADKVSGISETVEKLNESVSDLSTSTESKVGSVSLTKVDSLNYTLSVDGKDYGITIPESLQSVSYENNTLIFTKTNSGESQSISLADLIDTYTAGNGLKLEDNKFSVVVDGSSDEYLIVTESGIAITGVKSAIQALSSDIATNATAIATETTRATAAEGANATAIATETTRAMEEEASLLGKIDANTTAISAEATTARAAESENAKAIETETTRATAAESANATAIATETTRATEKEADLLEKIEANAAAISANALDISSLETDVLQNTNDISTNSTSIADLLATVATKANSSDVYTKLEMTNTLSDYAKTEDVTGQLSNKLNITDASNTYATKEALQDVKDTYATKTYVDSVDEQLDAAISTNAKAISNFDLDYNEATSVLTFTDKDGTEHSYNLYSGSLVTGGTFDEAGNNILLYIETSGVSSTITIPVESLLSDVSADIKQNADDIDAIESAIEKLANNWAAKTSSTVTLTKTTTGDGDTLTADVRIATGTNQAITADSDGLFVSNDLGDYTVVYGDEGSISGQAAISKIYGAITSLGTSVDGNYSDISDLKTQVSTNTGDISTLKGKVDTNTGDISTLKTQVSTNTSDISTLKTQVSTNTSAISGINTTINSLTLQVSTNTTGIGALENEVEKLGDAVDENSEAIENINTEISNITEFVEISDEDGNLLERLDDGLYISNIIDGGTF